ncbi:SPOR domain-containing protein [Marinilabilia sp.]|uniref:HU domain-containing protein n=1 Tax=Marinilabilia sp. TaxID=2021252 RepID=UPI0025BB8701|nr:SPOR domain-containing protein [Marinilabilia sp.]
MASIEKHISDLLCLHDCVIVPGLGGFVANYKSATIVDERNLFRPPLKEIGFNRSLAHNDGLLTNHIIKREQKSWTESTELINEFVKGLQNRINQGETIEFNGIGSFRKDALGNLQFNPTERNSLLPGAFGLEDFHFEPLLRNTSVSHKQEEPVRRLLQSRSPRYWTSVAAMIAGLLLFSPKLDMPEHRQMDTSSMLSALTEEAPANTENAVIPETTQKVISAKELLLYQGVATQDITPQNISKPFHLIAGSFKYEAPANQTLEAFRTNGFAEAKVLHSDNGRFRIALFSFTNRADATQKLFALRKDEAYKNVWLLTQ